MDGDTGSAKTESRPEGLPLEQMEIADLQDHVLSVATDLSRLQTLLTDATDTLLTHFSSAHRHLENFCGEDGSLMASAPGLSEIRTNLGGAITALQFQDMAFQLIAHTVSRLHTVADRLAAEALGEDGMEGAAVQAPTRPNPVTQSEMDAGSVELF